MFVFRIFSGLLAGLVAVVSPIQSFALPSADTSVPGVPYSTGNASLDRLLGDYESSVRARGDSAKLNGFLREAPKFRSGQLSEELRDDVLKSRIDSVGKFDLSGALPRSLSADSDRKAVLKGLIGSMKKWSSYRLIVRSSLEKAPLTEALSFFWKTEVALLSSEWGKNTYEISFPHSGRYAKFLSIPLEKGEVPNSLFEGIEIVKPFVVESSVSTGSYLSWESLASIWGISKIGATNFQYGLSTRPKVRVGVIDTGVSLLHPDLKANVFVNPTEIASNGLDDDNNGYVDDVSGYNFYARSPNADDDHGHGTHVSWVIAAAVNGKGVFGVDSSAQIVPMKVLSAQGYGSSYAVIDAINYAANNGVKVVNMSLGGSGDPANDSICRAISYAKTKGVLAVVAAGNENADVSKKVPAGCADALTVSAVDSALKKASFSNYGAKVDVAAPWVNVYSTYPGGRYATMAGTSMATPFVSGLAASVFAHMPSLTPEQVKMLIRDPANTLPVSSPVNVGRFVDMGKTMSSLGVSDDSRYATGQTSPNSGSGTPTGSGSSGGSWSGSTGSGTFPPQNVPPTLSVWYSRLAANSYLFTAMATDSDGTIVRYEFKNGTTLVSSGMVTSVQVSITQNSSVTVSAYDNAGALASKTFQLAYEAPAANKAPVVTASVSYPSAKLAYVGFGAADSDGKIAKVQLYLNGRLVYTAIPNAVRFNATLALSRWKPVVVKVVATDDKWSVSEKSVTVQ